MRIYRRDGLRLVGRQFLSDRTSEDYETSFASKKVIWRILPPPLLRRRLVTENAAVRSQLAALAVARPFFKRDSLRSSMFLLRPRGVSGRLLRRMPSIIYKQTLVTSNHVGSAQGVGRILRKRPFNLYDSTLVTLHSFGPALRAPANARSASSTETFS